MLETEGLGVFGVFFMGFTYKGSMDFGGCFGFWFEWNLWVLQGFHATVFAGFRVGFRLVCRLKVEGC